MDTATADKFERILDDVEVVPGVGAVFSITAITGLRDLLVEAIGELRRRDETIAARDSQLARIEYLCGIIRADTDPHSVITDIRDIAQESVKPTRGGHQPPRPSCL